MKTLLRFFFRLLYHQFAFTYDLVAATVSFNRWKDWVMSVLPFIEGTRVLEMGHGPGHLQRILLTLRHGSPEDHRDSPALACGASVAGQDRSLVAVGIDESAPMGRLAKRNLRRWINSQSNIISQHQSSILAVSPNTASLPHNAYTQINLTRGLAQYLPFSDKSFDTIIATFPTEYITDPRTLAEVKRCLANGARLVVLPVALPKNRFLDWLFRVTHQSPMEALEIIEARLKEPFVAAGFQTEVKTLDLKSGTLLIVLAKK